SEVRFCRQCQFAPGVTRKLCVWFTIQSYYLLSPCVRHATEDARFGDGGIVLVAQDPGDRNPLMTEASQQQSAGLVVADNSNRQNVDAQVCQIVHRVGAAAGNNCAFAMSKNEDWGLTRDAGYFAEYEFVGDHIAEHGHG